MHVFSVVALDWGGLQFFLWGFGSWKRGLSNFFQFNRVFAVCRLFFGIAGPGVGEGLLKVQSLSNVICYL